jgi:hypothetical protein
MTDVFQEAEEVRTVISSRRPEWQRDPADRKAFYRLRADWSGGRGFLYRARHETDHEAKLVKTLGNARLERARRDVQERREMMSHLNYDSVSLKGWTARPPAGWGPGWPPGDIDAWRVMGATGWWDALVTQRSKPHLDWLAPFVDVPRFAREHRSWNQLWSTEVEPHELPRAWMRWAFGWLQGLRKVTPGTPADNSIALHTYEADVFITGDGAFADILEKLRDEAPAHVAAVHRARSGTAGVDAVLELVAAS